MWIYEEEQKCIDEMSDYAKEAKKELAKKDSSEIIDKLFINTSEKKG